MTLSQRITQNIRQTTPRSAAGQTLCAVQLVDRRTGTIHRINGRPLLIITRNPQEAATELLSGRDPSVWETRIDAIEHRADQTRA